MGWDFCQSNIVAKTRKDHICEYCGRNIPKGSKNIYHWQGKYEGEFQNSYACNYCEDHKEELIGYDDEIIYLSDVLYELYAYKFDNIYQKYFEADGDYFVLKSKEQENELIRVYCPIQRKEDIK